MDTLTVKFEIIEEGVGFGMSELKEYVLPESNCSVSPWAGRWGEYFKQVLQQTKVEQSDGTSDVRRDIAE